MTSLLETGYFVLAGFIGLWLGWHMRATQRPPIIAPVEVREHIAKRIVAIEARILEGSGHIHDWRERRDELQSLLFEINRREECAKR